MVRTIALLLFNILIINTILIPKAFCKNDLTVENFSSRIEEIDIFQYFEPLLKNPQFLKIYSKSLRIMDLLNGCSRQCKFCYIDAKVPTRIISADSFIKLFSDKRFKQLLMEDSLRVGNSGDIADHPEAYEIISFLIREFPNKNLRVLTNYRHRDKRMIKKLIKLASKHNSQTKTLFNLMISIGEENIDVFYEDFIDSTEFIFNSNKRVPEPKIPGIEIKPIFSILNGINKINTGKAFLNPDPPDETNLFFFYEDSGNSKTILNADGFFLYNYVTLLESRNAKIFTEITPLSYEKLAQNPFHPDFKTPPNWPGGTGEKRKLDKNFKKHCQNFFELLRFDNPHLKLQRLIF
jgi:hypothetical protein